MNFHGGYNLLLDGRPDNRLEEVTLPEILYLPLKGERFNFTRILVANREKVRAGQPVAEDPAHFDVPLLAPCSGTADLTSIEGHVALRDLSKDSVNPIKQQENGGKITGVADPTLLVRLAHGNMYMTHGRGGCRIRRRFPRR